MTPIKKPLLSGAFLLLILACPALTQATTALGADEDSLLQQIGRMIGDAIRGGDSAVEAEMEFGIVGDDGLAAAPNEKEREDYNLRIHAYCNAMKSWVIHVCAVTEEQKARAEQIFTEEASRRTENFARMKDIRARHDYRPATFPVTFTVGEDPVGAAISENIISALKRDLLTSAQQEQLDSAMLERSTTQREAWVSYLVSLFDDDLFLTENQRKQFVGRLLNLKPAITSPLYSFQPQSYYVPYQSLADQASRAGLNSLLEPVQKKRMQDLVAEDHDSHIVFQASSGVEGWRKQMNELSEKQRENFLRAAAVRVAWYQRELKLSAEQVEFLSNAGKGATMRALGDWKESTQQTLDQMEEQIAQMGGDFGFGAEGIDTRSIDQNEIWTDAVKSVTSGVRNENLAARATLSRRAMAASVLAILDTELWLLPEQRQSLLPLVEVSLPRSATTTRYQEYIRDIILVAHPLLKIPEETRNAILTEPQQEAWKRLQSLFQYQKGNSYVEIQLRNDGGSFGFSLEE